MVSVILIWTYMVFTCYIAGFACLRLIRGKQEYRFQKTVSCLYAGIAAVTVYAQFFSIFYKVGLAANLALLLLCLAACFFFKKELAAQLHTWRLTITPVKAGVVVLLFLLFAYGTSRGIIHYDTGLYHAQSIRWIEEYGIVPGLGNLHSRLAYNSAAFSLSALYSFAFLGGRSFHCCAGFLAFLLALTCGEAFRKGRAKRPLLSDFVRIMAVYYLLIIFDEMISPASDYFMVLTVFYVIIRWLELLEEQEKSFLPYALLSLLCVWVITVKLSGALILLLVCKPAFLMLKEKRGKEIARFLGLGFVTALPFLIRNVILSGWLVYPFTFIDWFSFDFKIPEGMAEYDSREIQVWGRGFSDVTRFEEPVSEWLPRWAASLDSFNRIFLGLAVSGLVLFLGLCVYCLWRRIKSGGDKKEESMGDYLLVMGTLAACFLFWLLSAPLIRYGCVYLWVFPALVWGFFYLKISPAFDRYKLFFLGVFLAGCYKAGAFGMETLKAADGKYLLCQKDYENFETEGYEIKGYTFYMPEEGDRTGYEDFPAFPQRVTEEMFRGERIEEGFAAR